MLVLLAQGMTVPQGTVVLGMVVVQAAVAQDKAVVAQTVLGFELGVAMDTVLLLVLVAHPHPHLGVAVLVVVAELLFSSS